MICQQCSATNRPSAHFCQQCGARLTPPTLSTPTGDDIPPHKRPMSRQSKFVIGFVIAFVGFVYVGGIRSMVQDSSPTKATTQTLVASPAPASTPIPAAVRLSSAKRIAGESYNAEQFKIAVEQIDQIPADAREFKKPGR